VLAGALAFGVAVDDAVHFVTYWMERRASHGDGRRAMEETLAAKGGPITFTSVILVFTFLVFTLSSFPPIRQFAGLCVAAFAAAWFNTCVALPKLLGLERNRGGRPTSGPAQF